MSPKSPVKIVLGTHMITDTKHILAPIDTLEEAEAVFNTFESRGYKEIDSSANYPGEKRLGEVGVASRFIVDTKVQSGTPGDHEPAKVKLSIERSLNDLQASSVEIMYLHVPDRQTPFEDTVKAIDDVFREGKFKKFGLSNYTAAEVEKIVDICDKKGYVKPSVYQGQYNAVGRSGEKELFPVLRKHNIAFYAYSPAAGGFFTGNSATAVRWSPDNLIGNIYSNAYRQAPVHASVAIVQDAAAKHGISAHDAAVRWTAFHGILDGQYGDAVIFGVSKLEQLAKNLDALESGPLPADLADAITSIWSTVEGFGPPYHL